MSIFFAALAIFFIVEVAYFKIADHFNIIDKPNQRSSHTAITLRGGGIVFPLALAAGVWFFDSSQYYLVMGVLAIATISFLDDVLTLSSKVRMGVHVLSVALMLFQIIQDSFLGLPALEMNPLIWLLLPVLFIFVIGVINAYNFMDGINGITVLYSWVAVGSFFFIQDTLLPRQQILSWQTGQVLLAAIAVFGFFNLRKRAKAFSGDVGSISMALILCFLILELVLATADVKWILLLGIYGLDAVATIFCRILRRENIFEAHRSHFYQYLANECKWPHVGVALLYAGVQLALNVVLFLSTNPLLPFLFFVFLAGLYISFRLKMEGKYRLFKSYVA